MRNYETDSTRKRKYEDSSRRHTDSRRHGGQSNRGWGQPETVNNSPVTFSKIFYEEKSHIKNLGEKEVEAFRELNRMNIKGKDIPKPIKEFEDMDFSSKVVDNFRKNGYAKPTPIQAQGWPMALSGRDMVGIAQTGSGKTLSFVLPALIHAKDQRSLRRGDGPIVLIMAPTRELVLQIKEVVDAYAPFFHLKSSAVYGGVSSYGQKADLRSGVEILVATPGRLIDLHDQGFVPLQRVTFLVLDEADRMLDMGFEPQLRKIIPKTNDERQTLMWSATWPREVRNLAESYMKEYIQVNIGEEELTSNSRIKQLTKICEDRDKREHLLEALRGKKNGEIQRVIVFCNKKRTCDDLEYFLIGKGFSSAAIHGDKSQAIRDKVIADFKSGRKPVLIATDVAARGLDVKDVKIVINYDFPPSCEDYIHRIGRTARGDSKEGTSLSFFTYSDKNNSKELIKILTGANQEVPQELREMVPRGGETKRFSRYGGGFNRGGSSGYGSSGYGSSGYGRRW